MRSRAADPTGRPWALGGLLALCILGLWVLPVRAQIPDRAGLIIVDADGNEQAYCLELPPAGSSGLDLLTQAGVNFVADYGNAMGASICRIRDTGCDFPAQDCFCRCQGAECEYWSYYKRPPGADGWIYSDNGATTSPVVAGSLDAWIWSVGDAAGTERLPPHRTLEEVCSEEVMGEAADVGRPPNWMNYAGFLLLLGGLAAAIWVQRYRNRTAGHR